MIESKTEFPAQAREVAAWTEHRQAGRLPAGGPAPWIRARPIKQAVGWLRSGAKLAERLIKRVPMQTGLRTVSRWAREGVGDGPLVNRFALHLVVILLAFGVMAIGRVAIPEIDFQLPGSAPEPEVGDQAALVAPSSRGGARTVRSGSNALFPAPVPHTTIPERARTEVITYTVQANDNLWVIAQNHGLQVETLMWANPTLEKNPDLLSVNQLLFIPPVDGVWYTVQAGDTVAKLAKTYQTTADKITGFAGNQLEEPYELTAGQKLMLPGGRKKIIVVQPNYYPMTKVGSAPAGAAKGSGRFAWPTHGYLSQRYWSGHLGIDVAGPTGTPIVAADAGYVVMAGRDTWGYGNQIVIDHGNGYMTRYAHLHKILVTAGQSVQKNEQIGTMGNTGRSTGPHLHFEVILNRARVNPLSYLP